MNINFGSLEHLQSLNDRLRKKQPILTEERKLAIDIFFGYLKIKEGR